LEVVVDKPVLQIIIASTRPGRVGGTVAEWVRDRAQRHGQFEIELIDLADAGLPLLDEPHHPRQQRYVHQHTRSWSATVSRADAFVFVMPEYNHGFNAALKNALDYLYVEWNDKPVGLVSYGGAAGGTRAVQLLKPVLGALQMVPVPEAVSIPSVHKLVDDGVLDAGESLERAADGMLASLLRWTRLLRGDAAADDAAAA
jgi:NAD(P)H-dependent FMN reductase